MRAAIQRKKFDDTRDVRTYESDSAACGAVVLPAKKNAPRMSGEQVIQPRRAKAEEWEAG